MFIVTKNEGQKINNDEKDQTCRPIKEDGKGYFKLGSIQQIRDSRNFKAPYICRVLVYGRDFVDLQTLTPADCLRLGYETKAEYIAQPYNQRNPSSERVRYTFIRIGRLQELAQTLEICPDSFGILWGYCRDCPELAEGVNPQRVFEGCDLEDLEGEFLTLQANICEVME